MQNSNNNASKGGRSGRGGRGRGGGRRGGGRGGRSGRGSGRGRGGGRGGRGRGGVVTGTGNSAGLTNPKESKQGQQEQISATANTNTNTNSASGSQSQSPPLSSEEQHLIQMMTSHPNVQIHSIPSIFNLYTLLESIIVLQPFDESTTQTTQTTSTTSTTSSTTQTQYMAKRACVFLSNLIGEFSGSNSATQYNCSLEFHHAVHVMFEHNVGLVDALKIAMGALGGIVSKLLTTTTTTTTSSSNILQQS
mmetsp:Transcript_6838/g.8627  ORF Transcript_6838/g.8627 Transcript_6838/m.8627 type:complete len:249 (-) Transcript_6838:170-916(-)